jgi:RNA polymerase sigma-70 factor (ECF subfamily)
MIPPRNSQQAPGAGPLDVTDPLGFAAQYRDAYPRLVLVAAGVTGDRESAEDLVQEAAIIAFEKIQHFSPGSNFSAWLAEIVRRCALNHRRKTQLRRTYAADPLVLGQMNRRDGALPEPSPIAPASGEILADQSSFDDELVAALQQLGDVARCCLLLRTIEKLSYAEIAGLMQIPEGTAMSHVHRSKVVLRRALTPVTSVDDRPA